MHKWVTEADFVVVPNDFSCLLGLKTVQAMVLFTINDDNFIAQVSSDTNLLGNLGEAQLHVNPEVPPTALPCRKLPLALQEDVKQELERLVEIGVLIPTVWVSQMAVVKKPDGSLRICIDPQPLNDALQREHYKLPTLDDVLPNLNNTIVFSKLDVKQAYLHVRLDKYSLLTTMITPFGWYRWARLPFGLKVSSKIFQRKINEALSGPSGVICVADDLLVMGSGNTREEADSDHEQNLRELQKRYTERIMRLNNKKSILKQTQVKFMSHLITNEGVQADKSKVEAILSIPAPTDIYGMKRFCGMI